MADYPSTLTRREALAILDPDGTGLVEVLALPVGPVDAGTWRGVVKLASAEPPGPPAARRRVTWREVASAEAPTAGEAVARAAAGYQQGQVVRFDRKELAGVYDAAYLRSTASPPSEREADAAEALARHVTVKALAEIAKLGANVARLRLALRALADAADIAVYDDATWTGTPVPPALLEALDQAERAARSALEKVELGLDSAEDAP